MKRILLPLVIVSAIAFTACKDKKETDREMVLLTDSSNISNLSSDTAAGQAVLPVPQEPVVAAPPVRSTSPTPRRTTQAPVRSTQPTTQAPINTPAPSTTTQPTTTPAPSTETAGSGTGTEGTTTPAPTAQKKTGMSNSAKGAIIGGVGGAVAGAVIGKNAKGAVIGGVIGAAGGYILGKKKDKKQAADTTNN
jgi:hypothetical protein